MELVVRRCVALGARERNAVGRIVGDTQTVGIRRHARVAVAHFRQRIRSWLDERDQAACRIAGHAIRIEVEAQRQLSLLHSGVVFLVGKDARFALRRWTPRLTPDLERDAGQFHQIALVAGVDEDVTVHLATRRAETRNRGAALFDAEKMRGPFDSDTSLAQHRFEHLLGDLRLEEESSMRRDRGMRRESPRWHGRGERTHRQGRRSLRVLAARCRCWTIHRSSCRRPRNQARRAPLSARRARPTRRW